MHFGIVLFIYFFLNLFYSAFSWRLIRAPLGDLAGSDFFLGWAIIGLFIAFGILVPYLVGRADNTFDRYKMWSNSGWNAQGKARRGNRFFIAWWVLLWWFLVAMTQLGDTAENGIGYWLPSAIFSFAGFYFLMRDKLERMFR